MPGLTRQQQLEALLVEALPRVQAFAAAHAQFQVSELIREPARGGAGLDATVAIAAVRQLLATGQLERFTELQAQRAISWLRATCQPSPPVV